MTEASLSSEARDVSGADPARNSTTSDRVRWITWVAWIAMLAFATRAALLEYALVEHVDAVEAALFDASTSLPALHFALFLLVAARRRATLLAPIDAHARPLVGLAVAGAGLGLLAWSRVTSHTDLQIDCLVAVVAGSAIALGGFRRLEAAILPLALLAISRPLPPVLMHHVHDALQLWTAGFAQAFLSPFMEVARSGLMLGLDGHVFEVIEGCSGFQLEVSLLTATLVYAEFLSRSRLHTLALIAGSLLLGPLLNGIRVVSIMLDPSSSISETHSTQGLLVIAAGVVVIGGADAVAARQVKSRATEAPAAKPGNGVGAVPPRAFTYAVLALAPFAIALSTGVPQAPPATDRAIWGLHEIGARMGEWKRAKTHELDRNYWGDVGFSNRLDWSYEQVDGAGRARIFAATDDPRRRDRSGYTPKTERVGAAWRVITRETVADAPGPAGEAVRLVQTDGREFRLSLHYRIGYDAILVESARWWLALDARPTSIPEEAVVVRIDVVMEPGHEARATGQLRALAEHVGEAMGRAMPSRR